MGLKLDMVADMFAPGPSTTATLTFTVSPNATSEHVRGRADARPIMMAWPMAHCMHGLARKLLPLTCGAVLSPRYGCSFIRQAVSHVPASVAECWRSPPPKKGTRPRVHCAVLWCAVQVKLALALRIPHWLLVGESPRAADLKLELNGQPVAPNLRDAIKPGNYYKIERCVCVCVCVGLGSCHAIFVAFFLTPRLGRAVAVGFAGCTAFRGRREIRMRVRVPASG